MKEVAIVAASKTVKVQPVRKHKEAKETLFRFPKDIERLVYCVTCLRFTITFKVNCINSV